MFRACSLLRSRFCRARSAFVRVGRRPFPVLVVSGSLEATGAANGVGATVAGAALLILVEHGDIQLLEVRDVKWAELVMTGWRCWLGFKSASGKLKLSSVFIVADGSVDIIFLTSPDWVAHTICNEFAIAVPSRFDGGIGKVVIQGVDKGPHLDNVVEVQSEVTIDPPPIIFILNTASLVNWLGWLGLTTLTFPLSIHIAIFLFEDNMPCG